MARGRRGRVSWRSLVRAAGHGTRHCAGCATGPARTTAPALLQSRRCDKTWLAPLGVLLVVAALVVLASASSAGRGPTRCRIGAAGPRLLLRAGLRDRPAGSARHGARREPRRQRLSPCCSLTGSRDAATSRATRSSPAAWSRSVALVAVFTFYPVVHDPLAGGRGRQRRVSRCPPSSRASRPSKIWGVGCVLGSDALRRRVEHAAAGAAVRDRLHGARSRVRADRHALAVPLQARAARAVDAADHHAAVRDRPRTHPALRPLRASSTSSSSGRSGSSPRAGSTACRAFSWRRSSRSRPSPSWS